MRTAALQLLWLLHAFTATAQELMKLRVSPWITAECDKQVMLDCNTSSLHGLSIKYMEWSQDKTRLCSVDSGGNVTHYNYTSHFHCEYGNGRLSLIFPRVAPVVSGESKPYRCKLRSNKGVSHGYTGVALQECCGAAQAVLMTDGPSCIFSRVHPDGDVHWFRGSHNLSDGSTRQYTTKTVDAEGYLTVQSYLDREHPHGTYNCSLKSATSGRYIANALVGRNVNSMGQVSNNGIRSHEAQGIAMHILIFLAVRSFLLHVLGCL